MARTQNIKSLNWSVVYKKLTYNLVEFYKEYKDYSPELLHKLVIDESSIIKNQKWFLNLETYGSKGIDPVHIYASFNNGNQKIESKIDIIKEWFRLINGEEIENTIDFTGCPAPFTIRILSGRELKSQKDIWAEFFKIGKSKIPSVSKNTQTQIQNWYGLSFISFTIFLFWIDPKRFLSLDKRTTNFLLEYKPGYRSPDNFNEYKKLLNEIPRALYQDIVSVSFDHSLINKLPARTQSELLKYFKYTLQPKEKSSSDSKGINFKLVALKINNEQGSILRKNLTGNFYQFYSGYNIGDEIIEIDRDKQFDIYSYEGCNISVSAIVGKNGSGKSALSELLFIAINNLYYHFLDDQKTKKFERVEGLKIELFYESLGLFKIVFEDDVISVFEYIKINEWTFKISKEDIPIDKSFLEKFFYTICVNYSLHGLNSTHDKEWLELLFIKNDGYENPIVFEPNREEGVININRQEELLRSRFLVNVLESIENEDIEEDDSKAGPIENNITIKSKATLVRNNLKISGIKLHLSEFKTGVIFHKSNGEDIKRKHQLKNYNEIVEELRRNFSFGGVDISVISFDSNKTEESIALRYLIKKLYKIASSYTPYKELFWDYTNEEILNIKAFIKKLALDPTHVTYKIYQTINFIAKRVVYTDNYYGIDELSKIIVATKIGNSEEKLIGMNTPHLVPPPFFQLDIYAKDLTNNNSVDFLFEHLSSGERQHIYSLNSIIYHLKNIDSVDFEDRVQYRCVNLILDEVELYAHPEMQRNYVNELLYKIKQVEWKNISGINICFITHSPFILSDIPSDRIMFLKETGVQDNEVFTKTFGANIHELLMGGFFLSNTIGEFALVNIKALIQFHTDVVNANKDELKSLSNQYEKNKLYYKYLVKNIGEEYISGILLNHISDIEKIVYGKQFNQIRIMELELEIERLKNEKRN